MKKPKTIPLPIWPTNAEFGIRNPECTGCKLHEGVQTVCVPGVTVHAADKEVAILYVGDAPGFQEDIQGEALVGPPGNILRQVYVYAVDMHKIADIYATNAVRCRPPENTTPPAKSIKCCSGFLREDIAALAAKYKRIAIVNCGAVACKATLGVSSLTAGLRLQATKLPNWDDDTCQIRVFSTNHPAHVIRDESKLASVTEHLLMVRRWINQNTLELEHVPKSKLCPSLPGIIDELAIDIETYGLQIGQPDQTAFHPVVMEARDGVPIGKQIKSLAVCWKENGKYKCGYFDWRKRKHRIRGRRFILRAKALLGMNLPFDLTCLRAENKKFSDALDVANKILIDLACVSFVENDAREERSLKTIAPLLGVVYYREGFRKYDHPMISEWRSYNVQDAWATFRCIDILRDRLRDDKRDVPWNEWWSPEVWLCIRMQERGDRHQVGQIQKWHNLSMLAQKKLIVKARRMGLVLKGKGSGKGPKSKSHLFDKAADELPLVKRGIARILKRGKKVTKKRRLALIERAGLRITDKTKDISADDANRAVMLKHLLDSPFKEKIKLLDEYSAESKFTSGCSTPFLRSHVNGFIYSTVYPVPSYAKDGQGGAGGTRQARIVFRGPARQTWPGRGRYPVRKAVRSRFKGGTEVSYDLGGAELVVAAWLSGDKQMIKDVAPGSDCHWKRTCDLFGEDCVERMAHDKSVVLVAGRRGIHPTETPKEWKKWLRQAGKRGNFLALFWGGANKYQESVYEDTGLMLPMEVCEKCIHIVKDDWWKLNEWQASLVRFVRENGWLDIPCVGSRRTWGWADVETDEHVSEIVNIQVQATAANIMLAWQMAIDEWCRNEGMQSGVTFNCYDDTFIDSPRDEFPVLEAKLPELLTCNWFINRLKSYTGRLLPIAYDKTLLWPLKREEP